jgi:hypothetical protein
VSPFAKASANIVGMSSVSTTPPFRKKRLQAYRGRGDIYAWLRTHCHTVAQRLAADETSWVFIAEEMSRHGIAGREGEAPTANAVLRVWQRVSRDMATSGEVPGGKTLRPKPPSRFPKDWSPTVLREQEIPVPAYLRPAGSEVPPYLRPPAARVPAISPPAVVQPKGPAAEVPVATPEPEIGSPEYVKAQIAVAKKQLADLDWYLNPGVKNRP